MKAGLQGAARSTAVLGIGVGALATVGVGAYYSWRLGRASAWAEIEALLKDRIDAPDEDAAEVLEAARGVVDAAARRPYIFVLAHVWPRVAPGSSNEPRGEA